MRLQGYVHTQKFYEYTLLMDLKNIYQNCPITKFLFQLELFLQLIMSSFESAQSKVKTLRKNILDLFHYTTPHPAKTCNNSLFVIYIQMVYFKLLETIILEQQRTLQKVKLCRYLWIQKDVIMSLCSATQMIINLLTDRPSLLQDLGSQPQCKRS